MCLITEQKKPFIAKKDMTVWKLLVPRDSKSARSPYADTPMVYEIGETYHTEMEVNNIPETYMGDHVIEYYFKGDFWKFGTSYHLTHIHAGFHSFKSKEEAFYYFRKTTMSIELYQCTIPKGSEYFLDATGLCVSNQIIINTKLNENSDQI